MTNKKVLLAMCTVMALSASAANAGPCNTPGKDAGSGPTPGYTGQSITTGEADVKAHPAHRHDEPSCRRQGDLRARCPASAAGSAGRGATSPRCEADADCGSRLLSDKANGRY
jgi:hypothetical protein